MARHVVASHFLPFRHISHFSYIAETMQTLLYQRISEYQHEIHINAWSPPCVSSHLTFRMWRDHRLWSVKFNHFTGFSPIMLEIAYHRHHDGWINCVNWCLSLNNGSSAPCRLSGQTNKSFKWRVSILIFHLYRIYSNSIVIYLNQSHRCMLHVGNCHSFPCNSLYRQ